MADISIHNVKSIKIEKYPLTNTFVCKIEITTKTKISEEESHETITLFSDNKKNYNSFIEVDKNDS